MSVFSKYCDKLIFESTNNIIFSNNNLFQELEDSGHVEIRKFMDLRSVLYNLVEANYKAVGGTITTVTPKGYQEYSVGKFNLKSVSPTDLVFATQDGKIFMAQSIDFEAYLESDNPEKLIELTIDNTQEADAKFTLNDQIIKRIYLKLEPQG